MQAFLFSFLLFFARANKRNASLVSRILHPFLVFPERLCQDHANEGIRIYSFIMEGIPGFHPLGYAVFLLLSI